MDQVSQLIRERMKVGNRHTRNYIERVKTALGIESDYSLAKHLQVSKSTVSNYQKGITAFSDTVCHRVAEILQEEPAMVLALIELDRHAGASAKELETRTFIARLVMQATQSKGAGVTLAACLLVLGFTSTPSANATVTEPAKMGASVYYVKFMIRRLFAQLRRRQLGIVRGFAFQGVGNVQGANAVAPAFALN